MTGRVLVTGASGFIGAPQRLAADPRPLRLATGVAPIYSIEQSIDDLLRIQP